MGKHTPTRYRVYFQGIAGWDSHSHMWVKYLRNTHVFLCTVRAPGMNEAVEKVRELGWSKKFSEVLRIKNLHHHFIGAGDVLQNMNTGKYFQVVTNGFKPLIEEG